MSGFRCQTGRYGRTMFARPTIYVDHCANLALTAGHVLTRIVTITLLATVPVYYVTVRTNQIARYRRTNFPRIFKALAIGLGAHVAAQNDPVLIHASAATVVTLQGLVSTIFLALRRWNSQ